MSVRATPRTRRRRPVRNSWAPEREDVDQQIDLRKERGARRAIGEAVIDDRGLLEVEEGGRDRVQQHVEADVQKIGAI